MQLTKDHAHHLGSITIVDSRPLKSILPAPDPTLANLLLPPLTLSIIQRHGALR